jgi:hypothetical protein
MSLKELQKEFLNYIYCDEALTIASKDIISPSLRESMSIYRRHIWHTLISTLEAHYISVSHFLGKKGFVNLAEQYIYQTPSKTPDLEKYGFSFTDFLKEHSEGYLYDLSQLDLAYVKSSISKDYTPTPIEEFKNISSENFEKIIFAENPTNIVCELSYDVFDIFTKIRLENGFKIETPVKNRNIIIVSRDLDNRISHQKISQGDALFLSLCTEGKNLYEIYNETKKSIPDFFFQSSLTKLIQSRYIIGFTIN